MKKLTALLAALTMSILFSIAAFAGSWQQDASGWKWQMDDGSYAKNGWQWIDGNNDGIAESFYFDANGYCLKNTTTPDGYTVNEDGAWVKDGKIQTQAVAKASENSANAAAGSKATQYVLNTNSMKFHRPGCTSVGKISASNRSDVTDTREHIISQGYDPCKNCNP